MRLPLTLALCWLIVCAHTAGGAPLLRAADGPTLQLTGIPGATALELDADALAGLRSRTHATLAGVPLAGGGMVDLQLERFDPMAGTRIDVVTAAGIEPATPPDVVYFRGRIQGAPDSRVMLAAARDHVRGFVIGDDGLFVVGRDDSGTHHTYGLADVDATQHPAPTDFCWNDLAAERGRAMQPLGALRQTVAPVAPISGALLGVDIAVDTDLEFREKFESTEDALAYLGALVAATNVIYGRDVAAELRFSYIRLWTTEDPWVASAPDDQLDEVQGYWTNPVNGMSEIAGPRTLVHFISGKPVQGGIAYVSQACSAFYGFGVSQVFGTFDVSTPSQIWDLVVVSHELGHGLGTRHTHCYEPALDHCYDLEPGCYDGPRVDSQGTLMSYCHLNEGGLSNLDLRFHEQVQARIRETIAAAPCVGPVRDNTCGNGELDAEEECDDGGRLAGDGCAPGCWIEVCGNGFNDPGEACDDGNAALGDGCTNTCTLEICGNGVLDVGEVCDDGNLEAGDGCSATCTPERCALHIPHQRVWSKARLVTKGGSGRRRLRLKGTFGVAAEVVIDPLTAGLQVTFEDPQEAVTFVLAVPGGQGWSYERGRFRYRDRTGAIGGIRKILLRPRAHGDVTLLKLVVSGTDGDYPETIEAMPTRVTVIAGGEAQAQAGACGQWILPVGACRGGNGGRLICR